jgi:acetyl-CoA carboxylase carboxyl transferase subunit beta
MDIFSIFHDRKRRLDELSAARKTQREKTARIRIRSRIDEVCDPRSTRRLFEDISAADPLDFPGYGEKVAALQKRSNLTDAFICSEGRINARRIVCVELIKEFLMGSMGSAVGQAVSRAAEYAREQQIPLIIFSASGGARMQEGMFSLMQMAHTSAAIKALSDAGGLYISVLTNPTYGGVTASFAMLGDIILAETGAMIGFAGPRVIEQTIGSKLPAGFQSAEFQQTHGFVDAVVERTELRARLTQILLLHPSPDEAPIKCSPPPVRRVAVSQAALTSTSTARETPINCSPPRHPGLGPQSTCTFKNEVAGQALGDGINRHLPGPYAYAQGDVNSQGSFQLHPDDPDAEERRDAQPAFTPQQQVEIARHPGRPHFSDFITGLFDDYFELHGDRQFGDDRALVGGIARFEGVPVTVVGHVKGTDLTSNLACNFGMPQPEGYRKLIRLALQAEKFARPLITFIDTPGAYPGAEAEERGQGEAIARCLYTLSALRIPIIAVLTGEGGSGGALALGVGDSLLMYEHAIYSILSPEGFASILWKDASRAGEACAVMRLTSEDLAGFGMADHIIPEPDGGANFDVQGAVQNLKPYLLATLEHLSALDTERLLTMRYERFNYAPHTPLDPRNPVRQETP